MRSLLFTSAVAITILLAGTLRGAPPSELAVRAGELTPWLDAQTIAVARIDFGALDTKRLTAFLTETGVTDRKTSDWLTERFQAWANPFRQAGGRDLYIVFSLADLPERPPYVVVPLRTGADEPALAAQLNRLGIRAGQPWYPECERRRNVLLAAPAGVIGRLKTMTAVSRPELGAAFEAIGDSPLQLFLLPSDDHRRVVREMLWRPLVEGGPPLGKTLSEGLRWSTLAVDLPPGAPFRWTVQSSDPASAARLHVLWQQALQMWSRTEGVRLLIPQVDDLLKPLSFEVKGDRLSLTVDAETRNGVMLLSLVQPVLEGLRHQQMVVHLKEIALALHNYHDAHNSFPPQGTRDARGNPLLSWRVHILPYLNEGKLYNEFHLDEPWDSPHNRQLIERIPYVYTNGNIRLIHEGRTAFQAPVGEQAAFGNRDTREIKDFSDGVSNTIFVISADDELAAVWTQPADWEFSASDPKRGLFGMGRRQVPVLFVDGSVHTLHEKIKPETLRNLFTRNGNESVGDFWNER